MNWNEFLYFSCSKYKFALWSRAAAAFVSSYIVQWDFFLLLLFFVGLCVRIARIGTSTCSFNACLKMSLTSMRSLKRCPCLSCNGAGPDPHTNCRLPDSILIFSRGVPSLSSLKCLCGFEAAIRGTAVNAVTSECLMPSSPALQESKGWLRRKPARDI